MPHSFETGSRNRRFWKSLLGCARRYTVCPSSGRQGDPPATLYDRERRPETRPMLKPRSITERTPPSFRYYINMILAMIFGNFFKQHFPYNNFLIITM